MDSKFTENDRHVVADRTLAYFEPSPNCAIIERLRDQLQNVVLASSERREQRSGPPYSGRRVGQKLVKLLDQLVPCQLALDAAHFALTIQREKVLGVDHWPSPEFHYTCHNNCSFGGPQRLEFRGVSPAETARSITASMCQSSWMTSRLAASGLRFEQSAQRTSGP